MAEKELKWYDIFVVLFGTILSIADPITDILTLVEFYRADHKTWFGVGLTFVILPSVFFVFVNHEVNKVTESKWQSEACNFIHVLVVGCNPLLPAWLKMQTLYCYLKKFLKLRQSNIYTNQTDADLSDLLPLSKLAVVVEAALESAPQFIIQLYAMVVQQESVSIIQMVSLPVSFLSLAWASTVGDELFYSRGTLDFSVNDRVLHFVTHLFILSSRLFAVALFTVSYKWWVTGVLIFHCTVITILGVWRGRQSFDKYSALISAFFSCSHWLRDDLLAFLEDDKDIKLRMTFISNVLFVIENITLILLFYFSHFPHTWFSLPVTICVCLFAVLGAVMRLTRSYFLYKDSDDQSNNTDRAAVAQ